MLTNLIKIESTVFEIGGTWCSLDETQSAQGEIRNESLDNWWGRVQISFPSLHAFSVCSTKVIIKPHIKFLLTSSGNRDYPRNLESVNSPNADSCRGNDSSVWCLMHVSGSSDYIHGGEQMKIFDWTLYLALHMHWWCADHWSLHRRCNIWWHKYIPGRIGWDCLHAVDTSIQICGLRMWWDLDPSDSLCR